MRIQLEAAKLCIFVFRFASFALRHLRHRGFLSVLPNAFKAAQSTGSTRLQV